MFFSLFGVLACAVLVGGCKTQLFFLATIAEGCEEMYLPQGPGQLGLSGCLFSICRSNKDVVWGLPRFETDHLAGFQAAWVATFCGHGNRMTWRIAFNKGFSIPRG